MSVSEVKNTTTLTYPNDPYKQVLWIGPKVSLLSYHADVPSSENATSLTLSQWPSRILCAVPIDVLLCYHMIWMLYSFGSTKSNSGTQETNTILELASNKSASAEDAYNNSVRFAFVMWPNLSLLFSLAIWFGLNPTHLELQFLARTISFSCVGEFATGA